MAEKTAEEKVTWDRPPWKTTFEEDHLEHSVVFYCSMYVASWPSFGLSLLWSILTSYMFGLPTVGGPIKTSPNWSGRSAGADLAKPRGHWFLYFFLEALACRTPHAFPPVYPTLYLAGTGCSSFLTRFQCAASGRELASLSALLREANATLDASKGTMQATLAKQAKKLETVRKVSQPRLFWVFYSVPFTSVRLLLSKSTLLLPLLLHTASVLRLDFSLFSDAPRLLCDRPLGLPFPRCFMVCAVVPVLLVFFADVLRKTRPTSRIASERAFLGEHCATVSRPAHRSTVSSLRPLPGQGVVVVPKRTGQETAAGAHLPMRTATVAASRSEAPSERTRTVSVGG